MENSVQPKGIEVSNNDQVLEIEWSDGVKSVVNKRARLFKNRVC